MNSTVRATTCLTAKDAVEKSYPELFETTPTKISIVTVSILLCVVNLYLTSGIMCYERFSSDNRRTLMNRLVASICLVMIKWIFLCQAFAIVRFPFSAASIRWLYEVRLLTQVLLA